MMTLPETMAKPIMTKISSVLMKGSAKIPFAAHITSVPVMLFLLHQSLDILREIRTHQGSFSGTTVRGAGLHSHHWFQQPNPAVIQLPARRRCFLRC